MMGIDDEMPEFLEWLGEPEPVPFDQDNSTFNRFCADQTWRWFTADERGLQSNTEPKATTLKRIDLFEQLLWKVAAANNSKVILPEWVELLEGFWKREQVTFGQQYGPMLMFHFLNDSSPVAIILTGIPYINRGCFSTTIELQGILRP